MSQKYSDIAWGGVYATIQMSYAQEQLDYLKRTPPMTVPRTTPLHLYPKAQIITRINVPGCALTRMCREICDKEFRAETPKCHTGVTYIVTHTKPNASGFFSFTGTYTILVAH